MPGAPGLQLRGVQCVRGRRTLFQGLDTRLGAGQLLRVLGANGAGKTSLLRMICGLLPPQQGQVLWQGRDVYRLREEFGRDLVFLGHAAALKAELSPLENLLLSCELAGHGTTAPRALEALDAAGLRGRARVPVRTLSQGQRRRAALARLVLSASAPLWVLDEPFNALDQEAVRWLTGLLARHTAGGGMAVLTSHQHIALPPGVEQRVLQL